MLQLLSADLDADSIAMARAEPCERFPLRVGEGLASVLRAALMLRRLDPRHDAVHTYGASALRAARLGWRSDRGPIVHTRGWFERAVEATGIRVRDPVPQVAVLRDLCLHGFNESPAQVSGVPATCGTNHRAALRKRLRVGPTDLLVWAPGRVHRDAGQRLAAWAMAILFVRDGRSRLLLSSTGDVESIRRFAVNNRMSRLIVESSSLSDAERAVACDAALVCTSTDRFERTPVLAAVRAGVPVFASPVAASVLREHGVVTVDPPKPRLFARAIVERFDPVSAS